MSANIHTKTVLLLGATGLVGSEYLKLLFHTAAYRKIMLLTRRIIPDIGDQTIVEQYPIDFDNLEGYAGLIQADHVVCALGTTIKKAGSRQRFREIDYGYPLKIARLAKQNGAQHFILVSAMGANSKSAFFYNRVKGELETALQKLDFYNLSIIRPSLLLGERQEHRPGEAWGKKLSRWVNWALPALYQPVHAREVAQAMLRVAREDVPGRRIIESDAIRILGQETN